MFTFKGKHAQAADYGVENKQTLEIPTEPHHRSKRARYNIPMESSSTWFEQACAKEACYEQTEISSNSQSSEPETLSDLDIPVESPQKAKRLRGTARHNFFYSSTPSNKNKYNNGGLRTDNSESENQSNGDAKETAYNDGFDFPVEEPRKIYLAPDRYAEYLVNRKMEEKPKRLQKLVKEVKPWEQRRQHERGPRAGRSDEFNTLEESEYAEGIVRAARRHRLETYHRERHEMWGLRPIQDPGLREAMVDSTNATILQTTPIKPRDVAGSKLGTPTKATSIINKTDVTDDVTIEEILQGIPPPSDPCFNTPADIIFLPRNIRFTAVVYTLEYRLGYTPKQVRWLMGGEREGRGPVPTFNGLGMRLSRYMKKAGLQNSVRVPLAQPLKTSAGIPKPKGKGKAGDSDDEEEDSIGTRPLLPHGPRIRRKEFGVHGWYYHHPHEIEDALEYHYCY
ncbi:hypothetical protein L873DRAFT_1792056 [Choiromyces venosus 120613-1]|uniref:Uncharacterized protein n=1 Tax=Choiromyces venosus 120613-1 TaxID=1336337 RepID=A0A3N4JGM3_9PEZI|nr:hypothetical protein L873DRAFT_1792056 [Choiromyces venosus 120613-1]